jgi:hypothetical protein
VRSKGSGCGRAGPRAAAEQPGRRGRKKEEGVGPWKKEERGKEALTRGATLPEREKEGERVREREEEWRRHAGPRWQRGRGESVLGWPG